MKKEKKTHTKMKASRYGLCDILWKYFCTYRLRYICVNAIFDNFSQKTIEKRKNRKEQRVQRKQLLKNSTNSDGSAEADVDLISQIEAGSDSLSSKENIKPQENTKSN